jgi:PiT family inorganic phosphate transporter
MSEKITRLNAGQGFTANLVTAFLVIFASRWGMPVSTTHVSVGSLSGVGLITKQANAKVLTQIVLSWVLTLPIAAILGGIIYWALPGK